MDRTEAEISDDDIWGLVLLSVTPLVRLKRSKIAPILVPLKDKLEAYLEQGL